MKYNLNLEQDRISAQVRLNKLKADTSTIEIVKVNPKRTIQQNKYIHVLFALFGIEFGYTLDESKTLLKRECSWMTYEKQGKKFLRHTSTMQTDELTMFIEWIRTFSAQAGLYLPTPLEYQEAMVYIDNQINSHKEYL
jgi:hypothetical protein